MSVPTAQVRWYTDRNTSPAATDPSRIAVRCLAAIPFFVVVRFVVCFGFALPLPLAVVPLVCWACPFSLWFVVVVILVVLGCALVFLTTEKQVSATRPSRYPRRTR